MQVKKTIIKLVVAILAAFPVAVSAQTSSINAFSPYSMYGIGELSTPGTLSERSMGGVGVAMRSTSAVNVLNPAAYSATRQKSFLFNFGVEGQNYYNSQQNGDATLKTSYNTFNFHDIAIQLPLTRGLGFGFSLTPYSDVGYRTSFLHDTSDDEVWGGVGPVLYSYEGEGDVTEVKFGVGWELFKNLSLGVAVQYYWGDISRTYTAVMSGITGEGTFYPTSGTDNYSISRIKGQFGLQWNPIFNNRRILTVGATYDIGGDLSPRVTKKIYVGDLLNSVVKEDESHLEMVLPAQLAVGLCYQTPRLILGADYVFQDWGSRNARTELMASGYEVAYCNTNTVKFGLEYTPNRGDIRHFYNRWSYRAGFRYGGYHQTFGGKELSQYAVTAGIGIPVRFLAVSSIDLGVEYGARSGGALSGNIGLPRQRFFKFALSFSFLGGPTENSEYWFVRPKYD